ncbi:hypothetical protein [Escherichia coli]|uniref:hypothetical protein n=3 Tax=Escherichia coli TaxID=562 RepID=UPI0038B3608B
MFCAKIISSGKNGKTIVVLSGDISIPVYFHADQFCVVTLFSRLNAEWFSQPVQRMADSLMVLCGSCMYLITGHIAISRMFNKNLQWFGNDATRSIIFSGGRMIDELFAIIGIKHIDMAEATVIRIIPLVNGKIVELPIDFILDSTKGKCGDTEEDVVFNIH